jgi:hypothetical protein
MFVYEHAVSPKKKLLQLYVDYMKKSQLSVNTFENNLVKVDTAADTTPAAGFDWRSGSIYTAMISAMAASRDGCDRRWSVSYTVTLTMSAPHTLFFLDGVLLLRHDAARLVLYDAHGFVIDARYLWQGDSATVGVSIKFPANFIKVNH